MPKVNISAFHSIQSRAMTSCLWLRRADLEVGRLSYSSLCSAGKVVEAGAVAFFTCAAAKLPSAFSSRLYFGQIKL